MKTKLRIASFGRLGVAALALALAAPLAWAQSTAKNAVESVTFSSIQGGKILVKIGLKEPLEAFPLEQLKMVGTLQQGSDTYALVRADKTLYRVKKGNYMGQNFGLITDVTDAEIKLKEIVQDSAGDWAERQSVLPLLEEAAKGDRK